MTEITLNKDEHIEYLSRDLGLIVSKEHTFGTDALLLADFASPKRYDVCCKGVRSAYALRQGKRFAGQALCVQCGFKRGSADIAVRKIRRYNDESTV